MLVAERERGGPYRLDRRPRPARAAWRRDELEAIAGPGACDSFGVPRRKLLWQLGLVPRSATVPGSGGEEQQLALPLEPHRGDARPAAN